MHDQFVRWDTLYRRCPVEHLEAINTGHGENFGWPHYERNTTERSQQGQCTTQNTQPSMRCSQLLAQGSGVLETSIYSNDHHAGEALPLPVQFLMSRSSHPNTQPLTYGWVVGDGGTSTAANRLHVSAQQGSLRLLSQWQIPRMQPTAITSPSQSAIVLPLQSSSLLSPDIPTQAKPSSSSTKLAQTMMMAP